MVIVWSQEFTAHRFGSTEKIVTCEKCQCQYVYTLFREVSAGGTSLFSLDNAGAARRAETRADAKLQRELDRGVDACPCPKCGHFQSNMIAKARETVLPWLGFKTMLILLIAYPIVGFVTIILNGILVDVGSLVPWPIFYTVLAIVPFVIVAMPMVRWIISLAYDPNRDTEEGKLRRGFYAGRPYARYDESNRAAAALLIDLRNKARKLINTPHPLDDDDEKRRVDDHLERYLRDEPFPGIQKDLLRIAAQLARGSAMEYRIDNPSKLGDYYQECADVLEGIYIAVFRELPRDYDDPVSGGSKAKSDPV